jgi:AcrR family transcriptional regulator
MAAPGIRVDQNKVSRRLIKLAIALALLGVLGFLFLRSVRGSRAQPYTLSAASLQPWTLITITNPRPSDPMLVWRPPAGLMGSLFDQLFKRAMESMGQPVMPGIPLVFQSEFAQAQASQPTLTPEAVLAAAREAGLDAAPPQPRCLGHRRTTGGSQGNDREQLYFLLFDAPAFGRFRQRLAQLVNRDLAPGARPMDPALASPALIVALVESSQEHWLPLHADPERDCVAPIAISSAAP